MSCPKLCTVFPLLLLALGSTWSIAAGKSSPATPPRTIYDVTALFEQFKPDQNAIDQAKAVLTQSQPDQADNATLARFHFERARAANSIGDARRRVAEYRKASEFVGNHADAWWVFSELAVAEGAVGNLRNAIEARKKSIQMAGSPSRAIHDHARQVGDYALIGEFEEARRSLDQLEQAMRSLISRNPSGWFKDTYLSRVEQGRGFYSFATGKYVLAEAQFRKSISALEDYIDLIPRIPANAGRTGAISGQKQRREGLLVWLSLSQGAQGKYLDAEVTLREALKSALTERGIEDVMAQYVAIAMASLLNETGRFAEGEKVLRSALQILQTIGVSPDSLVSLLTRQILTDSLVGQEKWREAIENQDMLLATLRADPNLSVRTQSNAISYAMALIAEGHLKRAFELLNLQVEEARKWLGSDSTRAAELHGLQGVAWLSAGNHERALSQFQSAIPTLLKASSDRGESASVLRVQRMKFIFEAYLSLLSQIRGTQLEARAGMDVAEEGFRLADSMRSQRTQAAVSASAARAAVGDSRLGMEIRKEQDLDYETASLHRILRDLMNVPPDQQLPKVILDMKNRIVGIQKARQELQTDIAKRFPGYSNLVRPQPASLRESRSLLKPDEALISIFTTGSGTYLWAFKRSGPIAFAVSKLNAEQIERSVKILRSSLDPGDVELSAPIPDFDLEIAHKLYAELLAPIESGWQDASHLLIATNGALNQLPLAVLPTIASEAKRDTRFPHSHLKRVPWLINKAALTQLPSINSFVTLRKLPSASEHRTAFVGFGDPKFAANQASASNSRQLRNLDVARSAKRDLEHSKTTEWLDYSKLPPLPDTRDEILALARALKADTAADVFLGDRATRLNVMSLDLSKRRVVAFATHGLMAGEFPGVMEPSLALANPGDGTHGLLTLQDILSLKLDADWVVLSACNTAAGDGQGADALSGLGRGFFYAGSRALLVTHWPVESTSARKLVTGIFVRQAQNTQLPRAEALRLSMLALMQDNAALPHRYSYAHPIFWAPYTVVGEGGN